MGATGVLLVLVTPLSLSAQSTSGPTVRTGGETVNLFETLDPLRPIHGAWLEVPASWDVEGVRLLRYGTEPVSVQLQGGDGSRGHRLITAHPVQGPHELILRVEVPERRGTYEWRVRPFVLETSSSDSLVRRPIRQGGQYGGTVDVERPPTADARNRALSMRDAVEPLLLRADALPKLDRRTSFTIEFWMQTNGLDEIVLSTWNGNESVAYPAEFVIDPSGRLRFYTGQPGRHRALRSGEPVADGRWHHVAAVYDTRQVRVRLLIDGSVSDSLVGQLPSVPDPLPIAVGGRLEWEPGPDTSRRSLFSGHVDELRIWSEARGVPHLRRMRGRPFRTPSPEGSVARVVRLGFDAEEPSDIQHWPEGARRVPVVLSFRSSLRNLRARSDGRTVTLLWAADSDVTSFIVERSPDGRSFTRVAELTPSEAERPVASDVPEFSFVDEDVAEQIVYYRIRQRRANGNERRSKTIKVGLGAPQDTEAAVQLVGNFPNPFAETTTVAYEVREVQPVTITVWDLAGHRLAQLTEGTKETGYHEVSFTATNVPSGTYFVRLETPNDTQSHRMVVLK